MTPEQALEHAINALVRSLSKRSAQEQATVLARLRAYNERNKGVSK